MAGKKDTKSRNAATGAVVGVRVVASERSLPKFSAAYVLRGGTGEVAYNLTRAIEGPARKRPSKTRMLAATS